MRVAVNLATRPFVELRPLLAKLRLAMVGLAVLAMALIIGMRVLRDRAEKATAQMDVLKAETAEYQNRMTRNEARMKQPVNRVVLERAQFLNELFAKKSFSWTGIMMDLEQVLPAGVQVTSIDPSITKEGDVMIRLRVSGQRDKAVELVRNLEKSKRFLAPRLSNESLQANQASGPGQYAAQQAAANPAGVQFDILSGYNPLTIAETRQVATGQRAKGPADKKVKSPAGQGSVRPHSASRSIAPVTLQPFSPGRMPQRAAPGVGRPNGITPPNGGPQ